METVVLDASFVLKWVLEQEIGFQEASKVHDLLVRGELRAIAPEILLSEVANVMFWKKKFSKVDILEFLGIIADGRIGFVSGDRFGFGELLEMMEKKKVTVYDAYYLVLAAKNKCKVMSFDKKLTE